MSYVKLGKKEQQENFLLPYYVIKGRETSH